MMLFPYKQVRKTQDLMVKEVYDTLKSRGHLIIHAPTGLGKTAATLAPALEYALENKLNIFFLTSKNTQHRIAVETLKLIKNNGARFNAIDFIGKRWMCLQDGGEIFPSAGQFWSYCREAKEKGECEFYENTKGIKKKFLLNRLDELNPLHVEELCGLCTNDKMCPFEIACELAKNANVVIADYFHLLSPVISNIFLEKIKKRLFDSVIIMDESHNLPSRVRDLQSSSISSIIINKAIKETKLLPDANISISVTEYLCTLRDELERLSSELEIGGELLVGKNEFLPNLDKGELIGMLESAAEFVTEKKKQSFIGLAVEFIKSWGGEDFGFARILSKRLAKSGRTNISLAYRCMDPSIIIKRFVKECHSVILMSGTLTPTNMYKDLLGFNERTKLVEYDNPFPKENKLNLIVTGVTTKFTARGEEMLIRIADYCARAVNLIPGNIIIFLPSYSLRDKVAEYFNENCKKTIFFEEQGMNKKERDELLGRFKEYKNTGAVLLAVSSGSFGEGIDLLGDYLKCVVIVGIPLSKPDLETKELIKYYEERFGRGWEYGYIYPAIIKCMQNAGRCIRSESDRGTIIFMDERYKWGNYFKCFPKDWDMKVADIDTVVRELNKFFNQ